MSRVIRHKHTLKEMMEDNYEEPTGRQEIVRVIGSRGNNLHEVESSQLDASNFLVSMPTKFRKNVWIKRGDYLLVEPIDEGTKVKGEICKILTAEHVKEYTKAGIWPKKFTKKRRHSDDSDADADADGVGNTNGDEFMVQNLNRRPPQIHGADDVSDNDEEATTDEETTSNDDDDDDDNDDDDDSGDNDDDDSNNNDHNNDVDKDNC